MGAPFDGGTGWGRFEIVVVVVDGLAPVVGVVTAAGGRAPA